jgi:hypothetical protein
MKICLLITGLYRDFLFSMKNNELFYNFENNDYDIFFLMSETEDIEIKKNEIKNYFKNKLVFLHNIFDNEVEKQNYYDEEQKFEKQYCEKVCDIRTKMQIKFYMPSHNIIKQFLKISKIQKIRKEYQEKNNIKYDCIIRARNDLCMIDDDYYTFNTVSNNCKNGTYHGNKINQSYFCKQNINTINKLFLYFNIKTNQNKEFSILQYDLLSINSTLSANKEINMFNNLFFVYDNIFIKNNFNEIITNLNKNKMKYTLTNIINPCTDIIFSSNETIQDIINDKNICNSIRLFSFFFKKTHCFCNEIEIISRMIMDDNIEVFLIDIFIATSYFKKFKTYKTLKIEN